MGLNLIRVRRMRETVIPSVGFILCVTCILSLIAGACAATTSLHIAKYGNDRVTVLNETTVTYEWMEQNLPVHGDGVTHFFLQGPVFLDDPDPATEESLRWNKDETINVREKDMGAVKGTDIRDLCDLVGGMRPGEILKVKAEDGFSKEFGYKNVYEPPDRQGPMVITWWKDDEGYVPGYREGMRLLFLADNSTNPWNIHALGVWDWHESADERYWYFYQQGEEKYPTTTGLSVRYVSDIVILPGDMQPAAGDQNSPPMATSPARSPLSPCIGLIALLMLLLAFSQRRNL